MRLVCRTIREIHQEGFSVASICHLLDVSRSSYYKFEEAIVSGRAQEDERLGTLAEDLFVVHRGRYGARRISKELARQGEICSRRRAGKLLKSRDLRAIQPKSYQPKTTESRHGLGFNDNLLLDAAPPQRINEVWVGDISYLPLRSGSFAYLAVLMDLHSRFVMVWNVQSHMREELVLSCLQSAIRVRKPKPGVVHHTDRGGQYAGKAYRRLLRQWKFRQSMSRADNCYDNAFMESCFGTIKRELELEVYDGLSHARQEIGDYVRYYNRSRIHSSLEYQTPEEFEQNHPSK